MTKVSPSFAWMVGPGNWPLTSMICLVQPRRVTLLYATWIHKWVFFPDRWMVGFPIHPQATLPPMQIDQHNEYYSGNLQHIDSHNSFINLLHGTLEFMNVSMYVWYLEVIVSSTWPICGLRRINDLTRISRLINNNHLTRYTIQSAAHTKQQKKTKMKKKNPDPQQMTLHMLLLLLLLQMSQLVHHFFVSVAAKMLQILKKASQKRSTQIQY